MPILKWSDIPGLREAIKSENDVRDAAFLDLTTHICGIEIRPMTPRDLIILDGLGNPLLGNNLPSPLQLADFLWRLSPQYRERSPVRCFMFGRRCRKIPYIPAIKQIRKYIALTFQDSPGGSSAASAPYAGWCAHLVDRVAREYGWPEEKILRTPLKRLFQYLKCIRRFHDPSCPMHNPSDAVKGDFLRLKNARQQLVDLLRRRLN